MKKGFTLIELLIVVAIIAVLAAIAVPNFLEAQTRSKVSRVKADIRSIAVAAETYNLDYQKYPYCYSVPPTKRTNIANHTFLAIEWTNNANFMLNMGKPLTTPIAYISSIPWDPFTTLAYSKAAPSGWGWPSKPKNTSCLYVYGIRWDWVRDIYGGPQSSNPILYRDVGCGFYSCGPASRLSWPPISYDPTNGTVSVGLLIYLGRGIGWIGKTGMEHRTTLDH